MASSRKQNVTLGINHENQSYHPLFNFFNGSRDGQQILHDLQDRGIVFSRSRLTAKDVIDWVAKLVQDFNSFNSVMMDNGYCDFFKLDTKETECGKVESDIDETGEIEEQPMDFGDDVIKASAIHPMDLKEYAVAHLKENVISRMESIVKRIDFKNTVLSDVLISQRFFNGEYWNNMKEAHPTDRDQVREVLRILQHKNYDMWKIFFHALKKSNQNYVMKDIMPPSDKSLFYKMFAADHQDEILEKFETAEDITKLLSVLKESDVIDIPKEIILRIMPRDDVIIAVLKRACESEDKFRLVVTALEQVGMKDVAAILKECPKIAFASPSVQKPEAKRQPIFEPAAVTAATAVATAAQKEERYNGYTFREIEENITKNLCNLLESVNLKSIDIGRKLVDSGFFPSSDWKYIKESNRASRDQMRKILIYAMKGDIIERVAILCKVLQDAGYGHVVFQYVTPKYRI